MSNQSPADLMRIFASKVPVGSNIEIPPKIFVDMEAEVVDFRQDEGVLIVRFPVKERYQNPMGMMQGGMIVAAIDNTVGPLSYLVAPPSVTTQLNTTYIRPISPTERVITVEARVVELTRRQLFFSARVSNAEGKTIALAQVTAQVMEMGG
jgi:uncharacterized protein (TIGR00369 family)